VLSGFEKARPAHKTYLPLHNKYHTITSETEAVIGEMFSYLTVLLFFKKKLCYIV